MDLPGYGYAKVPEKVKLEWQRHLAEYLQKRASLKGLVLVMDVRHPLTEFDLALLDVADERDLPVHILLTKADKLKQGAAKNALQQVRSRLREWEDLVSVQLFSALKRQGVDEALLLDAAGRLVEGTRSNIVVVLPSGPPATPTRASGAVAGVALAVARERLPELVERPVPESELRGAGEILALNAVRGARPITQLDGSPVGDGRPGPWAARFAAALAED